MVGADLFALADGGLMRRLAISAVVSVVFAIVLSSPGQAITPAKRFTDCGALNAEYPSGVVSTPKLARLAVRDGFRRPQVLKQVALRNDALSPDLPYVCPVRTTTAGTQSQAAAPEEQSEGSNTSQDREDAGMTTDTPVGDDQSPEFEVDPDELMSIAYWPAGVVGPQNVEVEVFGPAKLSGSVAIGGFNRRYAGTKEKSWQRMLEPTDYGDMRNVRVSVTRDARQWPVPNARPLPSGKMGCRIRIDGDVVSEYSVSYAWRPDNKVNLARCEVRPSHRNR